MRLSRFALTCSLILACALPTLASTHARRGPTSPRVFSKRAAKSKPLGQRAIEDERAAQIQTALIKSGYLSGEPSGHWDPATQAAMEKLQSDSGWQTRLVPDARAIIKLGLGSSTGPGSSLANQTGPLAVDQPKAFDPQ